MAEPIKIKVYKSIGPGSQITPDMEITANAPIPDFKLGDWRKQSRKTYRDEARKIYGALKTCLPGGTFDHLFVLMADGMASLKRVSP